MNYDQSVLKAIEGRELCDLCTSIARQCSKTIIRSKFFKPFATNCTKTEPHFSCFGKIKNLI